MRDGSAEVEMVGFGASLLRGKNVVERSRCLVEFGRSSQFFVYPFCP